MFELVVIWENGDKDIYEYPTEEQALKAGANMVLALGAQVAWYGVRPKR